MCEKDLNNLSQRKRCVVLSAHLIVMTQIFMKAIWTAVCVRQGHMCQGLLFSWSKCFHHKHLERLRIMDRSYFYPSQLFFLYSSFEAVIKIFMPGLLWTKRPATPVIRQPFLDQCCKLLTVQEVIEQKSNANKTHGQLCRALKLMWVSKYPW